MSDDFIESPAAKAALQEIDAAIRKYSELVSNDNTFPDVEEGPVIGWVAVVATYNHTDAAEPLITVVAPDGQPSYHNTGLLQEALYPPE